MKRIVMILFAAVILSVAAIPAMAADSGADPLDLSELRTWSDSLLALAEVNQLLNDPTSEEPSEDGYTWLYDFGALYFTRPERDGDCRLTGAVIYDDTVPGPRGTNTLTTLNELLDAFYNDNEQLDGSHAEALLYLGGELPGACWWASVQRDGQWVDTVQYAVHEPLGDGTYSDAGLVYTLQQNTVVAIRVYGLDAAITAEEVQAQLNGAADEGALTGYTMVPTSDVGDDLLPFAEEDLDFAGIDFLTCTPEDALAVYGDPVFDDQLADGEGRLRVLGFDDCELVFSRPAGGEEALRSFTVTADTLEGPRALRVGDSVTQAIQRFRFGGDEAAESLRTLYGTPGEGSWGTAEYGEDASATLRYGLTLDDGRRVVLMATFEMLELSEITVYID